MEDFRLDMDEYLPLREVVYKTLRRAILKGEFKPGERLMEITLANRLGVSRTPVREAVRQLESEGLVVIVPRKGAQVAEITHQDLKDVLEVRKSLEILAVVKACRNMTKEDLATVIRKEELFKDMLEDHDVTALAEADEAFHGAIYEAAGNKRLLQILSNLREQMYRFRVEYLKKKESWEQVLEEHRSIVQALEARDEKTVVKLTGQHIDSQRQAIEEILEGKKAK